MLTADDDVSLLEKDHDKLHEVETRTRERRRRVQFNSVVDWRRELVVRRLQRLQNTCFIFVLVLALL
jgi:hypothetical protein